ncbi:MAG: ATPase RavA [Providencia sp.]|uniref:ATPase RavA n=1 Tax=Providencia sp. TaxID=589 RepID=UPI003F973B52
MQIAERIAQLSNYLESGLYERQQAIRLCLLATLCGESVFLLGPPGIAKSLIARRMKFAFRHANAFEYLMTRFSTPEEIFGPLSIQALKDEGRYERLTKGYLPDSEVVFLDEIWKAGPAILNTLLTAVNERKFRNGDEEKSIPMRLLVTASNELPDADNSLEALFDRMLIRIWLDKVQEKQNFRALLTSKSSFNEALMPDHLKISDDEYHQWQKDIPKITLPDHCFELIYQLREQLDSTDKNLYVSDRRWKKAVYLLQASAFFNGRNTVSPLDIVLLKDCLWHDMKSMNTLPNLLKSILQEDGWQQRKLEREIEQVYLQWMSSTQDQNNQDAFKVNKNNAMFARKASYLLPENIREGKVTLFLHRPLQLHNMKVTFVTTDTKALSTFLNKGATLSVHLNGIGFALEITAEVNNLNQVQLLDISHQSSTLYVQEKTTAVTDLTEWLDKLDKIQNEVQSARYQFEKQQPNLFIETHWLADIEESFIKLSDKLIQLRNKISGKVAE